MKALILLSFLTAARAGIIARPVYVQTGVSTHYRNQDDFGHYSFGYAEDHATGGSFRKESGDGHGNVAGSYGLHDADGRLRIVTYVADAHGFRADIKTNEPGVEPQDPAAVSVNKEAVILPIPVVRVKPAPTHYVPVYASAPLYAVPQKHHYSFPVHHHIPLRKHRDSAAHDHIH